jgi:hypothetical protein
MEKPSIIRWKKYHGRRLALISPAISSSILIRWAYQPSLRGESEPV